MEIFFKETISFIWNLSIQLSIPKNKIENSNLVKGIIKLNVNKYCEEETLIESYSLVD